MERKKDRQKDEELRPSSSMRLNTEPEPVLDEPIGRNSNAVKGFIHNLVLNTSPSPASKTMQNSMKAGKSPAKFTFKDLWKVPPKKGKTSQKPATTTNARISDLTGKTGKVSTNDTKKSSACRKKV